MSSHMSYRTAGPAIWLAASPGSISGSTKARGSTYSTSATLTSHLRLDDLS